MVNKWHSSNRQLGLQLSALAHSKQMTQQAKSLKTNHYLKRGKVDNRILTRQKGYPNYLALCDKKKIKIKKEEGK